MSEEKVVRMAWPRAALCRAMVSGAILGSAVLAACGAPRKLAMPDSVDISYRLPDREGEYRLLVGSNRCELVGASRYYLNRMVNNGRSDRVVDVCVKIECGQVYFVVDVVSVSCVCRASEFLSECGG